MYRGYNGAVLGVVAVWLVVVRVNYKLPETQEIVCATLSTEPR